MEQLCIFLEWSVFSLERGFSREYQLKQTYYHAVLNGDFPTESQEIIKLIRNKSFKGIIVYPEALFFEPIRRPQQFLKNFASRGYLCLFCHPGTEFGMEEIEENLFLVRKEEFLLPVLRTKSVLVLCTWMMQMAWADLLPHKFIWYDIHDRMENFSFFDENMVKRHEKMVLEADLITYSAKDLFPAANDEKEIVFLPETGSTETDVVEQKIKEQVKGWPLFANDNMAGKIAVSAATFFDFKGELFYSGGAERYLTDLAEICTELGREMVIFQYGDYYWIRRYGDVDVVSLSRAGHNTSDFSFECVKQYNRFFYEEVTERANLSIYSAFFQAWPVAVQPSIGISHGVAWDNPACQFSSGEQLWEQNKRFIEGARLLKCMVSVDSNTANWFQTIDFETGNKMKVIPNYVDLNQFYPLTQREENGKITILYPRRLYEPRGFHLVLGILDDILDTFPNVEFHFVGQGDNQDVKHLLEKQRIWGDRIKWSCMAPENMHQAYQTADITLIPTLYSEGTSLSCLEAMACGNAIVATRIGGLTDLIIDGYNGLRIEPQEKDLKEAILELVSNKEKRKYLSSNGLKVVKSFSKERWIEKWSALLQQEIRKDNIFRKKSNLIVIYIEEKTLSNKRFGNFITDLLAEGDLVYLFVKDLDIQHEKSFSRIQWMKWYAPIFASPVKIFYEKKLKDEVYARLGDEIKNARMLEILPLK